MTQEAFCSIIINNYNYEHFLDSAIASALNQTCFYTEVIVIDDGSTDNSKGVIKKYRDKLLFISKANGGQASAFNTGFKVSKGDIIIFLDSDDILLPSAVESAIAIFKGDVSKAHWPLLEMDEAGIQTGAIHPNTTLPKGDLVKCIIDRGPGAYVSPPTSGNAFSRAFLEKVLPIPEDMFRINADSYLFMLAPFFGLVERVDEPMACYRIHGSNNYKVDTISEARLTSGIHFYNNCCDILERFTERLGIQVKAGDWKTRSWFKLILDSVHEIKEIIPEDTTIIFVDNEDWGVKSEIAGRKVKRITERDGKSWGPPADDAEAISSIERHRKEGASYLVFAWQAFWFLDYYKELKKYLMNNFPVIVMNERLIGFNLIRCNSQVNSLP